jgi:alpha-glucuronidase
VVTNINNLLGSACLTNTNYYFHPSSYSWLVVPRHHYTPAIEEKEEAEDDDDNDAQQWPIIAR